MILLYLNLVKLLVLRRLKNCEWKQFSGLITMYRRFSLRSWNLPRLIKRDRDRNDKVRNSKIRKLAMLSKGENRWLA